MNNRVNSHFFLLLIYYSIFEQQKNQPEHLLQHLIMTLNYHRTNSFLTKWATRTFLELKCILADNPQRGALLNMHIHSGVFGCHRCNVESQRRSTGGGRLYPIENHHSIENRNFSQVSEIRHQIEAGELSPGFMGVRGSCILEEIDEFDPIKNVLCEYMHIVPLGIVKHFLAELINDNQLPRNGFKLPSTQVKQRINQILNEFKSVSSFTRRPRDLSNLPFYKASEFDNFLFYYSLKVLPEVLTTDYSFHFFLLSNSMFTFLSESASETDLRQAKDELELFLQLFLDLKYPEKSFRYNLHAVKHIPEDREEFGPLKYMNAYKYESFLGFLKSITKGVHFQAQELAVKTQMILDVNAWKLKNDKLQPKLIKKISVPVFNHDIQHFLESEMMNSESCYFSAVRYKKGLLRSFSDAQTRKFDDSFFQIIDKFYRLHIIIKTDEAIKLVAERLTIIGPFEFSNSIGQKLAFRYAYQAKSTGVYESLDFNQNISKILSFVHENSFVLCQIINHCE